MRGFAISEQSQPAGGKRKVALVIAAHPDDPDFGVGGTAALWSQQDWDFHYLVVTNGSKGSSDRTMTLERLVPMRQEEQRAAARTLGVRSCTFLSGEDGELEYSRQTLGQIVREIRRLQPDAVFTHTPDIILRRLFRALDDEQPEHLGFINHRDHRTTGIMAVDAVYPTARDYLNFSEQIDDEGLQTHNVLELYLFGSNDPNFAVDVTETIERKIAALTQHVSQFADRGEAFFAQIKKRWRDPDDRYYERFEHVVLPG